MRNRYVIHVDMDAFFAAIEERDRPELKGKPIVVGADPKGGKGRGVVSTCSYAARRYGIHSAMPISIAYKKCPECIFLPVDFEKYDRISSQIVEILGSFSPELEQVSVDEAFLDITGTYKLFGTPCDTCLKIKDRIKKETGLTASIGLAPNKMAAKIASGLKKPDGFVEVKKEDLISFLEPLDVGLIWGVGPKTKKELSRMSINTIGDLASRGEDELISLFGKEGGWFWKISHGIDDSEVVTEHETKSISNESTFDKDTADRRLIEKELAALSELVADRLREEKIKARTITLKIRLEGFRTYTRSTTLQEPTNFTEDMLRIVQKLYDNFEIKEIKVRLVGVRASNLSLADKPDLFRAKPSARTEALHKAIDEIKTRFGKSSISRASSK